MEERETERTIRIIERVYTLRSYSEMPATIPVPAGWYAGPTWFDPVELAYKVMVWRPVTGRESFEAACVDDTQPN